jgi:hypothetical protein
VRGSNAGAERGSGGVGSFRFNDDSMQIIINLKVIAVVRDSKLVF